MGEPSSIGVVVGVLESRVLLDRGGVGQMKLVPFIHQPVDQPVPVVGRLDDDALKQISPKHCGEDFTR